MNDELRKISQGTIGCGCALMVAGLGIIFLGCIAAVFIFMVAGAASTANGDEPPHPGMIRYGDTFYPDGTLERIASMKIGNSKEAIEVVFVKLEKNVVSMYQIKTRMILNVPMRELHRADQSWVKKMDAKDRRMKRSTWNPG